MEAVVILTALVLVVAGGIYLTREKKEHNTFDPLDSSEWSVLIDEMYAARAGLKSEALVNKYLKSIEDKVKRFSHDENFVSEYGKAVRTLKENIS